MVIADILKNKLASINGQDYGAYQSLLGEYDFSHFKLIIQQIPKDPYAPPHTGVYRIQVRRDDKRIINFSINSKIQKISISDFLARIFFKFSQNISGEIRGTGFSGIITINQPGQAILERNSVIITDDVIEVRCFLGLPANGRIIVSEIAEQMLLSELPEIVEHSLFEAHINQKDLTKHIETTEDAEYLRSKLDTLGLTAFIANDASLPRKSGTSDKPLLIQNKSLSIKTTNNPEQKVVPFISPNSLIKEINLPHAGLIKGMGIPKGVTLITGGGYHGKSTLLNALEVGIYNHIPGDGREQCVSNKQTAKVRAYSGRSVTKTDISGFIRNLPFKKDTTSFSTENASGSTSQAANIIEAMEAGAEVLLMDEDTCATNFMIRDSKMQQLVNKEDEPITTFIDRVKQLYIEHKISTVLVLGGVGDYFDVSDQVIQMKNYTPSDVTSNAQQIAADFPAKREIEDETNPISIRARIPIDKSVSPLNKHGKFSVYAKEIHRLNFGDYAIDLIDLEQLIELSQTKALGYAMVHAKKYMDGKKTLREITERVIQDINDNGMDIISDRISGHFAMFRSLELAFTLNRLRSFNVSQKDINT